MLNITKSRRFNRKIDHFSNYIFRDIARTPKFASDPSSPIIIYSVLGQRHINCYLLALKSFLRYCTDIPVSVVVQEDGSFNQSTEYQLRDHISGLTVLRRTNTIQFLEHSMGNALKDTLNGVDDPCFFLPLKLFNVIYRFPQKFVILFDSDLLFLKPPNDILKGLRSRTYQNFHSPGGNGLSDHFQTIGFDFPVVQIERFNAGFFGFYNSLDESTLYPVMSRIAAYDKRLFANWEIEQAIWSVVLNSCGVSRCLKDISDKYVGNGWRSFHELLTSAVVVHFVGSTRFRNWTYPRLAKLVVNELRHMVGNR